MRARTRNKTASIIGNSDAEVGGKPAVKYLERQVGQGQMWPVEEKALARMEILFE